MSIWRNLDKNKRDFQDAARSKAFIVLDTETTGVKQTDEIVEFAARKCIFCNGKFEAYDKIDIFIKPSIPMPEAASAVNGITDAMLADKPTATEALPVIRQFMGDTPVIGAYNSGFDVRMIQKLYRDNGEIFTPKLEIDLLKVAKDIFCDRKMKDHKLGTIAITYGVDDGIEFHNASDDVRVLVRVINAMILDMSQNGDAGNKKKLTVYKVNYYPMYRGNARIYVITSGGPLYYDFLGDRWMANDESFNLDQYDMADLERKVFQKTGSTNYKELREKCEAGEIETSGGRQ